MRFVHLNQYMAMVNRHFFIIYPEDLKLPGFWTGVSRSYTWSNLFRPWNLKAFRLFGESKISPWNKHDVSIRVKTPNSIMALEDAQTIRTDCFTECAFIRYFDIEYILGTCLGYCHRNHNSFTKGIGKRALLQPLPLLK